jgi:hypothetical protein
MEGAAPIPRRCSHYPGANIRTDFIDAACAVPDERARNVGEGICNAGGVEALPVLRRTLAGGNFLMKVIDGPEIALYAEDVFFPEIEGFQEMPEHLFMLIKPVNDSLAFLEGSHNKKLAAVGAAFAAGSGFALGVQVLPDPVFDVGEPGFFKAGIGLAEAPAGAAYGAFVSNGPVDADIVRLADLQGPAALLILLA